MNGVNELLVQIAEKEFPQEPEDYTGEDGLLYCGKCHTRKQRRFEIAGREMVVHILCKCGQEERDREAAEYRRREEMEHIRRMKGSSIHDRQLLECTFETDDGTLPQISSAKKYVETWEERLRNNDGLLLWGDIGTGKTFYAACIANALIERGVSVLMTNFAKILNKLSGIYSDDKNEFVASLMRYSLLVIDDFGIERNTEYALEQVFNVIDERYKTKKPLIVTTNLSIFTLKHPEDTAHKRIYDRVLSMCVPVSFIGENHREKESEIKIRSCSELFEEGEECIREI
ncbi:MAG: ATP-binding protein [Clostridiales bacterium]|nr:ATP-binding protein [Clostridiales bacterium]